MILISIVCSRDLIKCTTIKDKFSTLEKYQLKLYAPAFSVVYTDQSPLSIVQYIRPSFALCYLLARCLEYQ